MSTGNGYQIVVLFLAANPRDQDRLRLDQEIRDIEEGIRNGRYRQRLVVKALFAVRPRDLLWGLNEHEPRVVHFSGHGTGSAEIVLEDDAGHSKRVTPQALTRLFEVVPEPVQLVVLNACYSQRQAEAITKTVDFAIGMKHKIEDVAAIMFASMFYESLAFGLSVRTAFDQAVTLLLLESQPHDAPELLVRPGADADNKTFCNAPTSKGGARATLVVDFDFPKPAGNGEIPRLDQKVIDFLKHMLAQLLEISPDDIEIKKEENT
ncbi:MAG: CHAT domain-containing protein [Planctomycetota bacterium]|jgi:hypothetical protein